MVFHSEKRTTIATKERTKRVREANGKEERGLHLQHQMAEIAQDLGAGEDKSHQNCMKAMLGEPLEEVAFTDQQLCQTGVRAVGAVSSAAGRRAAARRYN